MTDLLDGTLSWRRFRVLVDNLPLDSATARAEIGEAAVWPVEAHLLAGVYDQLAQANWYTAAIHTKGRAPARPKPVPRPGVAEQSSGRKLGGQGYSVEEFDRIYAEMTAGDLVLEEVDVTGGS